MDSGLVVVLDVGKTNAKLTLWNAAGQCLAREVRPNPVAPGPGYRALDAAGIEAWLREGLGAFARQGEIRAIVPVTHGAAAALVRGGELFAPPMDYEEEVPAADREAYDAGRDDFAATGSPALPLGLNLGAQLHRLEALTGPWPDDVRILPWPQYWAWRLCGTAASEATSLGCHTDLWRVHEGRPTLMAERRGWAGRMAPLRRAGEVLGTLSPEWAAAKGIGSNCAVLCGLHDSNAALLAARGHAEIAGRDATVLSTGTWFVAMRSPAPGAEIDCAGLSERRDCLVNVDVDGRAVPSARFMGGRESELIAGLDSFHLTEDYDPAALIARLPALIAAGVRVLPTFTPGVGPFPDGRGRWENEPADASDRRAALGLYLALMADVALDLIGSRDRLLVEGRFAEAEVFVRALAALRPDQQIYVSNAHDEVPYGALRLLWPQLKPHRPLIPVRPLDLDLAAHRSAWRAAVDQA